MGITETQTPPERCPICQMDEEARHQDGDKLEGVTYGCGLSWWRGRFDRECSNAFDAALRCGATLEPTPLEQARAALVDAAKEWQWQAQPEDDRDHPEAVLYRAVDAYLAALPLEPAP